MKSNGTKEQYGSGFFKGQYKQNVLTPILFRTFFKEQEPDSD